jgi:hypothetical protein
MSDTPIAGLASPALLEANSIIPRLHLSNLSGNASPVLALISDSLGLPGNALGSCNQLTPSQCLWAALKDGFRRQNPQAVFNFDSAGPDSGNFAIGGAGWQHVLKEGEVANMKLPPWFTRPGDTWLSHAEALAPDILVFNLGINHSNAGFSPGGGNNALFHVTRVLANIAAWPKIPNILFITNKVINRAILAAPGSFNPGPHEAYKGVAAALRTLARSHGGFFTAGLPPILQRFGLIDAGRHYAAQVLGKDVANQYFMSLPSAAKALAVVQSPVQLGTTTDGDFAFIIQLPKQGGGELYDTGIKHIRIQLGPWAGQTLTLRFHDSAGGFSIRYSPVDATSPHALVGPKITLPPGDFRLSVECRQERMTILVNNEPYIAACVPRLISGGAITLCSVESPVLPPRLNVVAFYEGHALPCPQAMTEDAYYGYYGVSTIKTGGPFGGNAGNHPASPGTALVDYAVISASNLAAAF